MEKALGRWSASGGGGWWRNPGSGNRDFWLTGWEVKRRATDRLTLGVELFHRTKDAVDGSNGSGLSLGGHYDFDPHQRLFFSVGQGVRRGETSSQPGAYLGYQLRF